MIPIIRFPDGSFKVDERALSRASGIRAQARAARLVAEAMKAKRRKR